MSGEHSGVSDVWNLQRPLLPTNAPGSRPLGVQDRGGAGETTDEHAEMSRRVLAHHRAERNGAVFCGTATA